MRLATVIIAPICALLLVACGGGAHGAAPPPKAVAEVRSTPGQQSTATSISRHGASLRLGQSASFAGNQILGTGKGEQVSVTVQGVINSETKGIRYLGRLTSAPPRGQRRIAIELTFRSTGTTAYNDSPEDGLSLIASGSGGQAAKVLPGTTGLGQCASDLSVGVDVPPGDTDRGCVFFQVRSGQRISAVRYQTQGGHYLATWTVR